VTSWTKKILHTGRPRSL